MPPSPESDLPASQSQGSIRSRSLTLASLKQIYSPQTVQHALTELPAGANEALRSTYEKMLRVGGERFCNKPHRMPDFPSLFDELPNFSEVLDDLRGQLALCLESDDPLRLMPILLLGEPGIASSVDLRAGVTVLAPTQLQSPAIVTHPMFLAQCRAADRLLWLGSGSVSLQLLDRVLDAVVTC